MSGAAQKSCLAYAQASSGHDRLCTAMQWKAADISSYYCSGINEACLAQEARLSKGSRVVRVCSPLPNGSSCGSLLLAGSKPTCVKGVCTGKKGDAMQHPALPSNPIPSQARLAGSAAIKQLKPKPAAAAAATGSIEVDVDVKQLGPAVPQDFLGISLEWPGIEYYAGKGNAAAWSNVLGVLGPGAIIRVGGSSQDKITEMPSDASWAAMATLHQAIGLRFIIGLPLNNNNEQLMAAMIRKARQVLPAAAIAGFELGNEPMYWEVCPDVKIGAGGWDAAGVYQPGWSAYAAFFDRVARKLTGCSSGSSSGGGDKMIIGPGWDNMNTFTTQRSTQVMEAGRCYLQDFSVHYYPYYSKQSFDKLSLLSENLVREASRNATLHVKTAAAYGQKVRITEANSLSGAGEEGTSDAYAAALWTVDISFEFAAVGIQSLHFHFGHGGLPGNSVEAGVPVYAGLRTIHFTNGTTAPQVRPPWFGYMLFQAAVSPHRAAAAKLGPTAAASSSKPGRLASITAAAATPGCSQGQIKIWPVVHEAGAAAAAAGSKELRVVLLNKSKREDCQVTVNVNGVFEDGSLLWMMPEEAEGPERMAAKRIMFGGATFTDRTGLMSSTPKQEKVAAAAAAAAAARTAAGAGTSYTMQVPRASAALLVAQGRV
uniref:Glycoside hydrolase family 79 protein n=1 Tax=Tetradesmus obliquus TaxID=3088 RepID=A0A383WPH3_TETOB|eukprot:jgi/Sobl393_1/8911/SZX79321.1